MTINIKQFANYYKNLNYLNIRKYQTNFCGLYFKMIGCIYNSCLNKQAMRI